MPLHPDPAYHNPPSAEITYWAFCPASRRLSIDTTTQHRAPEHACDLHFAYTAWCNSSAQPLQVLAWSYSHQSPRVPPAFPEESIPATFEFRSGAQSVQTEPVVGLADEPVSACFGNVTAGNDSVIKLLHADKLYLYEPRAGALLPALPDTPAWRTLKPGVDLSVAFDPTNTAAAITDPRLRVCSLGVLAAQFLASCCQRKVPELATSPPQFSLPRSILLPAKRVLRARGGLPGSNHSKTLIAFGAWEKVTRMYHLMVFVIQLPCADRHPRVQLIVAKAYGGLGDNGDAFELALRMSSINTAPEAVHDCEHECSTGEVGVRKPFVAGLGGLEKIDCPGLGITIRGWAD